MKKYNNPFKKRNNFDNMIKYLENRRFLAIVLVILIAGEIFWFSSLSGKSTGNGVIPLTSILYHFAIFFELNFFLLIALVGKNKLKKKTIFFVLFLTTIYAILDEVHQFYIPFRSCSLSDFLTDFSGITLSSLVYLMIKTKHSRGDPKKIKNQKREQPSP